MILRATLMLVFSMTIAFYQDEYRVKNERCDLISWNHSYTDNITFALSLVNRTTRAFNLHAHLLIDCGMDVRVIAQYYKFLSNEYRFFPATIRSNLCKDILEKGLFGLDDIKKHSNVELCPFKKGWYHINNYIPDDTKFPPHVPYGKYKAEMKFFHNSDFVLELHWYAKFEEIIKWH